MRRLPRRATLTIVVGIVAAVVVGRSAGWTSFPAVWDWTRFDPVDDAVAWIRDNLRSQTRWFSDFIVTKLYLPPRDLLTDTIAWPVPVFVTAWACWKVRGPGLAAFAVGARSARSD